MCYVVYCDTSTLVYTQYHMAGNFWGRKLSQIGEKYDFRGLLTFAVPKVSHPQISQRILSQIATKPRNSQKFSPSKVSHYTVGGGSLALVAPILLLFLWFIQMACYLVIVITLSLSLGLTAFVLCVNCCVYCWPMVWGCCAHCQPIA